MRAARPAKVSGRARRAECNREDLLHTICPRRMYLWSSCAALCDQTRTWIGTWRRRVSSLRMYITTLIKLTLRRPLRSPVGAPPPGPLRVRVGAVLGSGHKTLGRAFSGSKTERANLGPRGGRAAGQREPGVRQHRVVNSRVRAKLDPREK